MVCLLWNQVKQCKLALKKSHNLSHNSPILSHNLPWKCCRISDFSSHPIRRPAQYVYIFFIHSCSVSISYCHAFMFISSPYYILYMQVAAITLLLFFSKNSINYVPDLVFSMLICCSCCSFDVNDSVVFISLKLDDVVSYK